MTRTARVKSYVLHNGAKEIEGYSALLDQYGRNFTLALVPQDPLRPSTKKKPSRYRVTYRWRTPAPEGADSSERVKHERVVTFTTGDRTRVY